MIRFASIGSGSDGNGLVIESGGTRILVDCGFGPRELESRLGRLELRPDDLSAILVTHEHEDHAGGALACARRFGVELWLTYGTLRAITGDEMLEGLALAIVEADRPVAIGDLEVHPFTVPHDAREPVQFVFGDGEHRIAALTDIGMSTPHVERTLSGCDALVLECNHDARLLADGPYPRWLKERISGPFGHLSNEVAANLLASLDRTRLQHLVAAHLSERNNRPGLARAALAEVMGCHPDWISIADQREGLSWREIR